MWHGNIVCQLVVSQHAVLKYISKYVAKAKKISQTYQDMLTRIKNGTTLEEPTLNG